MMTMNLPVMRICAIYLDWPGGWAGYLSLVTITLLICIAATRHYSRIRWLFEWPEQARLRPTVDRAPQLAGASRLR